MFLIKLKTIGNCVISDLDDFIIYNGNNTIIDLEQYFDKDKIDKSMLSPKGNLYQLIASNVIERISPNNIEWKKQERDEKVSALKMQSKNKKLGDGNTGKANKKTFDEIMIMLKDMTLTDCKKMLSEEYFDNERILHIVSTSDEFAISVRKLAKELLSDNLDKDIDSKFVVI
ncbi:MAG: hypothetical protein PHS93_08235 [Candidatus Omnitrophica bacterium]|nr:hypothetical protein [Candidatus Omnitrophota bacterium]MDD5589120.1 hypothetical protein [Candidatus Nanoarchaeia archaeon]